MSNEHIDKDGAAWYVNDTRGYSDAGPACNECGACDCSQCSEKEGCDGSHIMCAHEEFGCAGLSVAYVCLDGGEALCEACATKEGVLPCTN